MIGAFLFGTTYESLVHKLGRKGPQTTKKLLDITTNHALGEEVVRAIFDHLKGKARQDEGAGEGTSNRSAKRKNKSNNTRTRSWPLLTARVVKSKWRAL